MIHLAQGDLLQAPVQALVNPVNIVGVMGKGLAQAFKRAYPEMYRTYHQAWRHGQLKVGQMHVYAIPVVQGPRYVINFPTKADWRDQSRLVDIENGLIDLLRVTNELALESIALPALGCGNGGLDWAEVEPLVIQFATEVPAMEVWVYGPQ